MPPKASLESTEQHRRHQLEVPDLLVLVTHIKANHVGEDMVLTNFDNLVVTHQPPNPAERIAIGNRAPRLGFGMLAYELTRSPKCSFTENQQDPEDLPAVLRVEHHLEARLWLAVLPDLVKYPSRIWRVVDHTKRVDQIVFL